MNNLSFDWISRTYLPMKPELLREEEALCKKREAKRINQERERNHMSTDKSHKASLTEMLGRGYAEGLLVECGRFLEVWTSPERIYQGSGSAGARIARERKGDTAQESEESIARRVNNRAKKRIRRLVNTNDLRDMLTLTLAPPSKSNDKKYVTTPYEKQKDYDYVRSIFKAFCKRLRREGSNFCYVAVFEMHNSHKTSPKKRGAWHIHVAIGAGDASMAKISSQWRHGIVDHQDFRVDKQGKKRDTDIENPGAYISKYIGKNGEQFRNAELRNKKRFTTSRNILKPIQNRVEDCQLEGDFERIIYKGQPYILDYYSAQEIPQSNKFSVSATYRRELR